jgi:hypothetical protein
MTLQNITLYNAIVPTFNATDKEEEEIDARDPKNRKRIEQLLGI